jgi:hypothetical protein
MVLALGRQLAQGTSLQGSGHEGMEGTHQQISGKQSYQ